MTTVRFVVETTFDVEENNNEILVPGELLTGAIRSGMTLHTEDTDQPVRVRAVEFLCSVKPTARTDGLTLVIDRADATAISPGTVLSSPA